MQRALKLFAATGESSFLEELRTMMVDKDYLPPEASGLDLLEVKRMAENIVRYRKSDSAEGSDGLDAVRHNLRLLRNVNLPDTRLTGKVHEIAFDATTVNNVTTYLVNIYLASIPDYIRSGVSANVFLLISDR